MAIDLVQSKHGIPSSGVCGIWCLITDGTVIEIQAKSIILATGVWNVVQIDD